MKSPSLYVLAVAFMSAPFFMGQAGPSLKGGGGCGCSDANETETAVSSSDTITGDATEGDSVLPASDTEGTVGDDGTGGDGTDDGAPNVCETADATGSMHTKDWSQDIESFVGLPVNEECKAECGGTGDDSPWTVSIHLKGSLLSEARSYSFSFMKDEFKDKVRYLEAKRDTADPDGCPLEEQDPCWRTCTEGECLAVDVPVKDGATLEKEAKALALDYLTNVCKLALKAEDLDAIDVGARIKAALAKISLTDTLQCTEGVALTATQIVPWAEKVLKAGLVRDEKGDPYTADQMFGCLKKAMLKD